MPKWKYKFREELISNFLCIKSVGSKTEFSVSKVVKAPFWDKSSVADFKILVESEKRKKAKRRENFRKTDNLLK